MRISYTAPCPIQGHIIFKKNPAYYGVGQYYDIDDTLWDVEAVWGRGYVRAVKVCSQDYFSTASWVDEYSIYWKPYSFEYTGDKPNDQSREG